MYDGGDVAFGFFMGAILGGMLALTVAGSSARDNFREQAVKAGVAFYSVNPETGETQFQYRTPAVAP